MSELQDTGFELETVYSLQQEENILLDTVGALKSKIKNNWREHGNVKW